VDTPLPPDAFMAPEGVAVDVFDRSVYVADSGNDRVQVFDATGEYLRTLGGAGEGPEELDTPLNVAVSGGRVYVSDHENDRVALFSIDGVFRGAWEGLEGPWGIAVSPDGTQVYVAENRASRIRVFRADGTPSPIRGGAWGRFGDGALDLNRPRGLAVATSGELIVANHGGRRLVAFDTIDGTAVHASASTAGAPSDVTAAGAEGLLATYDDGVVRRHQDRFGLPAAGAELSVPGARGIGADGEGGVYVTFVDDARPLHGVQHWETGTLLAEWGAVPLPLGRIDGPLRVAADDHALLADRWRRVQRFGLDGVAIDQLPAGAINDLVVGPDGDPLIVRDGQVERLSLAGEPGWSVDLPATFADLPWAVSAGYDVARDLAAILDLGRQRVRLLNGDGTTVAEPSIRPGLGASVALWDIAAAPGGWYTVNRTAGTVELRRAGSMAVDLAWSVPGDPLRVASNHPDDPHAYVLNRHGWVWKYAPDGELRAVWRAGEPEAEVSQIADIAAAPGGRVLAVDSVKSLVEVWAPDPDGIPGEVPTFEPTCDALGDKVASPTRLVLGEETEVTLSVGGNCSASRRASDIVLTIDRSGSMLGEKIVAARDSARAFVEAIDFSEARVAVVAFNQEALVEQPLTGNPANVLAAIDSLVAGGGTDIASAVDASRRELTGPRRRAGADSVIVLMTDGGSAEAPAVRSAELAKLEGARIFTIGFGAGANEALLGRLASAPADYYFAPGASELTAIYRLIAERIEAAVLFRTLAVTDEVPANMRYVDASSVPPAAFDGRSLTWTLADVPFDGLELRYRLEPLETGTHPTNVFAVGEGRDGLGNPSRVDFPVPVVEVIAPTATPTPLPGASPTPLPPSPTPSPTATPKPVLAYLPVTLYEACVTQRAAADVVLVLDTSTSMKIPTLSGRLKLEAAVDAARVFVGALDLTRDRAAIVAFSGGATIEAPLTRSTDVLGEALDGLSPSPGTRIDLGLRKAIEALGLAGSDPAPHERNRTRAVILLTDGIPTGTTVEDVIAAANEAHELGILVYAIGLGADIDRDLLRIVASDPDRFLIAPDAEDLERIYREIARELPCVRP